MAFPRPTRALCYDLNGIPIIPIHPKARIFKCKCLGVHPACGLSYNERASSKFARTLFRCPDPLHPALPYPRVYPYTLRGFLISVGRCRVREPRTISNYNVARFVPASRRLRVFSTSLSVYLPRKQFYFLVFLRGTVVRGVVQAPALAVSRF